MATYFRKYQNKYTPCDEYAISSATHVLIELEEYTKLLSIREELAQQQSLYSHMLAIMKDKANAERKLYPKKEHSGYVFMYTSSESYRYREKGKWEEVELFKTSFQTPYAIEYPYEEILRACQDDFEGEEGLGLQIGITGSETLQCYEDITSLEKKALATLNGENQYRMLYLDEMQEMEKRKVEALDAINQSNYLIAPNLRANGLSGFWEFTFKHNKPLSPVPEYMRVIRQKKEKK